MESNSKVIRLRRKFMGWWLGPYVFSGPARVAIVAGSLVAATGGDVGRSLIFVAGGAVALVVDVLWRVELEEERLVVRSLRKRSFLRHDILSAYLPRADEDPTAHGRTVTLRLKDGKDFRIQGSTLAADCPEWVEQINGWLSAER